MSGLYTVGRIRTKVGSTAVMGSWVAAYTGLTGSFTPGEALDWNAGTGATTDRGVFIEHDAVAGRLYFHREATMANPVHANTLYGRASGATAVLVSPAIEQTWTTQILPGNHLRLLSLSIGYQIQAVPLVNDQLSTVETHGERWGQDYLIARDFTPRLGLVRLYNGDRNIAGLLTRSIDSIDLNLARFRAATVRTANFAVSTIDDLLLIAAQTSGTITGTLVAANSLPSGSRYSFTNGCPVGSGRNLTIVPSGSDTINGGTITLGPGESAQVVTDGTSVWYRAF